MITVSFHALYLTYDVCATQTVQIMLENDMAATHFL